MEQPSTARKLPNVVRSADADYRDAQACVFGQADGIATRVLMVFAFRLNQALVLSPPSIPPPLRR